MFEVKTTITLSKSRIQSLLCTAFEGGSNYWYRNLKPVLPEGIVLEDFCEGGRFTDPKEYWHWCEIVPLHPGCALTIEDQYEPLAGYQYPYRLDMQAIERGVNVMAEKCPRHFADVINENDDAITGDVFLQCCLFGEVIYG